MTSTLVIQSHTHPLPFEWLGRCIQSVKNWCDINQFNYEWIGDELFTPIDPALRKKVAEKIVVASDLGRLFAIQKGLESHDRVVWLDTDFLIFDADRFVLPEPKDIPLGYMVGREVWVQEDPAKAGNLKAYRKVHNAFLLFDRGNSFLNFYLHHAEKLLAECDATIPPQFIGPKLLTAIHNVVGCPVLETAGMLCPLVIDDLISESSEKPAIDLYRKRSDQSIYGANLCSSLAKKNSGSDKKMARLIDLLLSSENLV